jgi:methionyl-tRNA formyltransferase
VAQELSLSILQPEKLRRPDILSQLAALKADVFVIVAYGKILSAKMLAIPPLGCINVHASLLPQYRGAAPIQWAVINREQYSGITIMQLDEGMDTGPMLLQQAIPLYSGETAGSLHDRLAPLGAELLLRALEGIAEGTIKSTPQPTTGASMAPMLAKEDGLVDFSRSALEVDAWIRGMDPWPGAFTTLDHVRLKLFQSAVAPDEQGQPGQILTADARGLLVACSRDAIWIREVQVAGRKRMPVQAFLAGKPISPNTRLG